MIRVITYGTYDVLHYGHVRLLERARALGDYLIVGVTADDFDKTRGKINVKQSLAERIDAVKATGLADKIIVEEYEGQKIDDILNYKVDVFTVGSDWVGKFDYLNEYCEVIYLDRTEGISSSQLRSNELCIRMGIVCDSELVNKYIEEIKYVNGLSISGICTKNENTIGKSTYPILEYDELLKESDSLLILSHPKNHFNQIKKALLLGKHVLCESPITMTLEELNEIHDLSVKNNVILMDSLKTVFSTAYSRMILLAKMGKIGKIISINATCTSLHENSHIESEKWCSMYAWFPTAVLPVFQIFGTEYFKKKIITYRKNGSYDLFSQINLIFEEGIGTINVGKGVKSEGDLIISGTEGYIYVPSPWWKTDYFEVRYEDPNNNKRYFYKLEGEGIRNEYVYFVKSIHDNLSTKIDSRISKEIVRIIEDYNSNIDVVEICKGEIEHE